MENLKIIYQNENLELVVNEEEKTLITAVPLSSTKIKNELETGVLKIAQTHFAPLNIDFGEKEFVCTFNKSDLRFWQEAQKLSYIEQLRLCMNTYVYRNYIDLKVTCLLDSANMLFDENLMPITVFRGIEDKLFPYTFNEKDFFEQYQALVLCTLYPQLSFEEIYHGATSLIKGSATTREIAKATDAITIYELLEKAYNTEKRKHDRSKMLVSKSSHRIHVAATYVLAVVTIALIGVLVYVGANVLPYQQRLLEAHDYFLATDYQNTIEKLKNSDIEKLPQSSQYELAYSYLQTESLSAEQRHLIQNNLSLKSDPRYLQYWIYSGKGDLDEALDLAKKLDDIELIIFTVEKQITAVQNDDTLSGQEKESQVKELTETLNTHAEAFNAARESGATVENETTEN